MGRPSAGLKPATSIVLVVEGEAGEAQLLWARRTADAPSLPGFYVTPGGLFSALDDQLPHDGGDDLKARVAGLRELFEETGILLAEGAEALSTEQREDLREALQEEDRDVVARFRAAGLRFRTRALEPIGRWVTPEFARMRYDTRFFAHRLPAPIEPSPSIHELDEVSWVRARDAASRFARGEALITPPLAWLLRNLADGRLDGAALRAVYGAQGEPAQRWEVVPGVQLLPFRTPTLPPATHTNSYLLGHGEAILVEPSTPYPDERERMVRWVEEARRDGIEVIAIFATHHHPDHIGGAEWLKARLGRPLWAHRATAERLESKVFVDRFLEDGEVLELAGAPTMRLRCVHTPGHAPGHLCLQEERSGVMIAGDMVASVGTILVEKRDGDMQLYLDSLRRMKALRPSALLPSHGLPVLEPDALLDHYVSHRLAREAKVVEALRSHEGPAQPIELVPRAYADAPKAVWPLAAMSLEAHLIKLERDGVACSTDEGWVYR